MTGPNDVPSGTPGSTRPGDDASRTRIIRRAPTGALPAVADDAPTTHIPQRPATPGVQPGRHAVADAGTEPSDKTAVAACAVSFLSGWATSLVATDLIAGWWRTDRLFCVAVGFLALVFAVTTVSGVIALLQRREIGRYLIVAGAAVALLTYGGVFMAGARVARVVHALPVLPIASAALALHPQTKRWLLQE